MVNGFIFYFALSLSILFGGNCSTEEPHQESRLFVRTMDFEGLRANEWMKNHVSSIKFLGDFVKQTVGSPTNVAVAQIGYIAQDGTVFRKELKKFFTSKQKLRIRCTNQELTPEMCLQLLGEKEQLAYEGFSPVAADLYTEYTLKQVPLGREKFKKDLHEFISAGHSLSAERVYQRQEEILKDRMDFYFHAEQAFLFDVLEMVKSEAVLQFDETPLRRPKTIFINILSYYDPCVRCGDFLFKLSEYLFREKLGESLEHYKIDPEILHRVPLFIELGGIFSYRDPLLNGMRNLALRPGNTDRLKEILVPSEIVPQIVCVGVHWL